MLKNSLFKRNIVAKINIRRVIEGIFYFVIFFPYIAFFPIKTDTQPNALVFSAVYIVIYLFIGHGGLPKFCIPFIWIALFSLSFMFYPKISFASFRSILGYFSLLFISTATYLIVKNDKFNVNYLKLAIWGWFFGGLLQIYISPDIFSRLVGGVSQRIGLFSGRGVASFAVEPTYYGTVCYLLFMITLLEMKGKKGLYLFICVFQILFLARSSMIVMVLIIGFVVSSALKGKWKSLLTGVVISGMTLFIFVNYMPESRIAYFIKILKDNPVNVFYKDQSANQRLSHAYYSSMGFIENYGIPQGYLKWPDFYMQKSSESQFFWYTSYYPDRIMSGYGAVLYELGYVGFLLIIYMNLVIINSKYKINRKIEMAVYFNAIMITAVPLSMPIIGFMIGIIACRKNSIDPLQNCT